MRCKEFQEQISAAVDRCLAKVEMDSFVEHAEHCPPCRREYELELTTKLVVHNRARMVRVPPGVQQNIVASLASSEHHAGPSKLALLLRRPLVTPAVAFAVTAVVVALIVTRRPAGIPLEPGAAGSDVIRQSVSNFHQVLNGDVEPQLVSSKPEELRDFFAGKTEFPVHVPAMREWALVGGVVNGRAGHRFAHVVYRHVDTIMYLYQACWETVQKGEELGMSDVAKRDLLSTGWYSAGEPDGDAVIAWTRGNTLCIAVARIDGTRLMDCLRSTDPPSHLNW